MSFFRKSTSAGGGTMDMMGVASGNDSLCPSLSWSQRFWGFVITVVTGVILSVAASLLLPISLVAFGVLYSVGNIMSLMGTGFLVGPTKQIKKMFEPTRLIATIVFLLALVGTLVVAFAGGPAGIVILCVIIQFCAFAWYSLSYIPFARSAVKSCVKGLI
eukprot:TRINITY_DN3208_c0_g1_i1.p2 TRINITY_DN3208_c0_g1~~TRINITY_DN3208_c0_g1_i1.p2  ORF type:complete len:160 (-),score=24.04 TRINITY_DN3208_c0_g1_i1:60-539(-)